MRGDVKVKAGGNEYTLRLTLGAMEEVAEVEVAPAVILGSLQLNLYTAKELGAVLKAGLKAGGETITADELADAIGGTEAVRVATELLQKFFRIDAPGKAVAAGKPETETSGS